jgi:hypothetical protein
MSDLTLLGVWVRRFLLEHLVNERNLARNTQRSYRDTLLLFLPFATEKLSKPVDRLTVEDLSADLVRAFLSHLEQSRQCTVATRNQRLAAIHALARFVGEHSPEHIAWCSQIRLIPFKKSTQSVISYRRKWTRFWPPQIAKPRKAAGTMPYYYFSTMPGREPMKLPNCISVISTWRLHRLRSAAREAKNADVRYGRSP